MSMARSLSWFCPGLDMTLEMQSTWRNGTVLIICTFISCRSGYLSKLNVRKRCSAGKLPYHHSQELISNFHITWLRLTMLLCEFFWLCTFHSGSLTQAIHSFPIHLFFRQFCRVRRLRMDARGTLITRQLGYGMQCTGKRQLDRCY
jgi:hypothetical protein